MSLCMPIKTDKQGGWWDIGKHHHPSIQMPSCPGYKLGEGTWKRCWSGFGKQGLTLISRVWAIVLWIFFFLFIISSSIIIHHYYCTVLYFQLLNFSYLNWEVLLWFCSPFHWSWEQRERGLEWGAVWCLISR